ncbi:helix-turn-helix domain-containing protein [Stutzerimonas xanthomarina]|uniref:helix-turn-helix domain-containing protein n=1 Tax=Stutzerimonas xanthomarina TaxID=271420 RepID=UPI00190BEF4C|nr:helix-turn-helix domain-containing protein [Stutzerimonas xanthomarina]MBK3848114.1 helix-turn-helix domain-containing protein [Stutzerimonas xanthomarina]
MNTATHIDIAALKAEISLQLGLDPQNPPVNVGDKQAAFALGVKPTTLAVWRSTGRYNLPFLKVGRLVKYRVSDLAEFLARRTANHTGEVSA